MNILAIDTSCDDTCVSIVKCKEKGRKQKNGFEILSNIVSSQVKIHAKYGGVYPLLAKREHKKNLPIVFKNALREAESASRRTKIDLIGITVGPGLEPCLWMGVNFAKNLAKKMKLAIIPVNHIEAHIYANWLNKKQKTKNKKQTFPAICLIVSGGHTQLILMKNHGQYAPGDIFPSVKYKILGETRDDAAGECFDKVARILGLGYPGGPAIEVLASKLRVQGPKFKISLPRPMIYQKNYDFSFSGLKTAVLYDFKSRSSKIRKSKIYIREMSKEVQQAIIDVLVYKTLKAKREYGLKTIILGGGVTANNELRKQFNDKISAMNCKINFLVPPENLCTDNAAMIAVAAYYNWLGKKRESWKDIEANANLRLG